MFLSYWNDDMVETIFSEKVKFTSLELGFLLEMTGIDGFW